MNKNPKTCTIPSFHPADSMNNESTRLWLENYSDPFTPNEVCIKVAQNDLDPRLTGPAMNVPGNQYCSIGENLTDIP